MLADYNEKHKRTGLMTNQPGLPIDMDRPYASTVVCAREECQEKARFWVQGTTGEAAVYAPDADRHRGA